MKLIKKVQPEWLVYVLLLYPFLFGALNDLLGLPNAIRYIMDVTWGVLILQMLCKALPLCRELGLERVLVTCNADNEGSRRTIVKNGGVYACSVREPGEDVDTERYWIAL